MNKTPYIIQFGKIEHAEKGLCIEGFHISESDVPPSIAILAALTGFFAAATEKEAKRLASMNDGERTVEIARQNAAGRGAWKAG